MGTILLSFKNKQQLCIKPTSFLVGYNIVKTNVKHCLNTSFDTKTCDHHKSPIESKPELNEDVLNLTEKWTETITCVLQKYSFWSHVLSGGISCIRSFGGGGGISRGGYPPQLYWHLMVVTTCMVGKRELCHTGMYSCFDEACPFLTRVPPALYVCFACIWKE